MQPDYASQKLAAAIIPKRTTVDQHGWFDERRCISEHSETGTVNINLYEPSKVNFGGTDVGEPTEREWLPINLKES